MDGRLDEIRVKRRRDGMRGRERRKETEGRTIYASRRPVTRDFVDTEPNRV